MRKVFGEKDPDDDAEQEREQAERAEQAAAEQAGAALAAALQAAAQVRSAEASTAEVQALMTRLRPQLLNDNESGKQAAQLALALATEQQNEDDTIAALILMLL